MSSGGVGWGRKKAGGAKNLKRSGAYRKPVPTVEGDVLDPRSLRSPLEGVHTAYYLVHSLGSRAGFQERDRYGAYRLLRLKAEMKVPGRAWLCERVWPDRRLRALSGR